MFIINILKQDAIWALRRTKRCHGNLLISHVKVQINAQKFCAKVIRVRYDIKVENIKQLTDYFQRET